MSRVSIVAVGSRGDVAPLTGVGVRLQEAGHDVVIAAYTPFADLITACGLGFRELPRDFGNGDGLGDVNPVKGLAAFLAPRGMRSMGEGVLAALRDEPADVLLLSPFSEFAGHALAEAKGIPAAGVRLQPLSATAAYPPAVLGAWSAGPFGNRFTSDAGAWLLDRLYGGVIAGFRRDLGLPQASARALRKARTRLEWPVLYGYSPSVAPRPTDWRPGLQVVGYWWPVPIADWRPPKLLTDFLAAGPAPVFVGFGSTVNTAERAKQMSDIVARAMRLAGVRGIIQAGWAGLDVSGDDVLTIGDTPHEWLFPRMAAIAHHCGAGTSAAGLRAGIPQIGIPGLGDQAFWASRLRQLGVSAAIIPQRKLTADRLAEAIRTTLAEREIQVAAQHLAGRIADEDGAAHVLAVVECLTRSAR
jgi:sterol 3beta-glucosyltransferase